MKFSDKIKLRYEEMKLKNSIKFSNMIIRDLQLGITPDGFIYAPGILDPITKSPESFTYNGFRYVEYTDRGLKIVEENPETRLFDPYNNMALMIYCFQWYIVNIKDIDINKDFSMFFITNNKMNCIGHSEVKLFRDADMNKYSNLQEFNQAMLSIVGHDYIRDCLKYYDMIMIFDNTLPYVFYNEDIKSIDMPPFDIYYNKEMAVHKAELDKKNHIKLRTIIKRNI